MMKNIIQFGKINIEFRIIYSERKTLGITVTPESNVIVKAPENSTYPQIIEKVKKKAPWIIKQQSFFLSFHPRLTVRKYINGETFLYLGRQYTLKILKSKVERVNLKGKFIEVNTSKNSKVENLIKDWYTGNADAKFNKIAVPLIERFKKYNVQPSELVLREMKLRWGSCTSKGKIILNPELIKAPRGCIEYVIIHELCHLIHHDHTQKFIDLQTKEMPDWVKWKTKLEKLLA